MGQFKDTHGRAWVVDITIGDVKRVRKILPGVDLADPASGTIPLEQRLRSDPVLLVDVIYSLIKPQADIAGVSDEQFGSALGGDSLTAANEEFWKAWLRFFTSLGLPNVVQAIQRNTELYALVVADAEKRAAEIDVKAMAAQMDKRAQSEMEKLMSGLKSPAPPESAA